MGGDGLEIGLAQSERFVVVTVYAHAHFTASHSHVVLISTFDAAGTRSHKVRDTDIVEDLAGICEDRFVTEGWQPEFGRHLDGLGAQSAMADRASRPTPHLIILVLLMEGEAFLVPGEVVDLLLHVDRGRLAVDVEGKLDVCELNILLLAVSINLPVSFLVGEDALWVFINCLDAFISLLLPKRLFSNNQQIEPCPHISRKKIFSVISLTLILVPFCLIPSSFASKFRLSFSIYFSRSRQSNK